MCRKVRHPTFTKAELWPINFPRWRAHIRSLKIGTGSVSQIPTTDNLDWGQHVSAISCKATKTVDFLWRNLALVPRHTKEAAYKTLVRPHLMYAALILHFYHKTQIQQVEKVHMAAARWTCRRWRNTSSVGDMLDELERPSLEVHREPSSLIFFGDPTEVRTRDPLVQSP